MNQTRDTKSKDRPDGLLVVQSKNKLQRNCGKCLSRQLLLRRYTKQANPNHIPPIVGEVLRSTGKPLNREDRSFFESRFGHDFSKVSVHVGSKEAESAVAVNALAYTVGNDVVFGRHQFAPETNAGRKLLAHELAHTIQQRSDAGRSEADHLTIDPENSELEVEAESIVPDIVHNSRPSSLSFAESNRSIPMAFAPLILQRRTIRREYSTATQETGPLWDVLLIINNAPESESEALTDFINSAKDGIWSSIDSLGSGKNIKSRIIRVTIAYQRGRSSASISQEAYTAARRSVLGASATQEKSPTPSVQEAKPTPQAAANQATTVPVRPAAAPPATSMSDPNSLIPIADFIRYVESVEKGYPNDRPSDTVTRIRVSYYTDIKFRRLIPNANNTELGYGIGRGGSLTLRNVDRELRRGEIDEEAYRHLTAHADENAKADNPSPYIQLASGERIDVGHMLLGLDALLHPVTSAPFTVFGVPNIDPSSFVADLGSASVWMTKHEESGSAPSDAPIKHSNPDLNEYYRMSAPEEDLLGDVDTFGVHDQWNASPGQRLSQIMRTYYLGQSGGAAGIKTRYRKFCAKNGFAYNTVGNQVFWYPDVKTSIIDKVDKFSDLFAAGIMGSAWATVLSPVTPPSRRKWPHTSEVVDKFLNWLKAKLEAELASSSP